VFSRLKRLVTTYEFLDNLAIGQEGKISYVEVDSSISSVTNNIDALLAWADANDCSQCRLAESVLSEFDKLKDFTPVEVLGVTFDRKVDIDEEGVRAIVYLKPKANQKQTPSDRFKSKWGNLIINKLGENITRVHFEWLKGK